MSPWWAGAAIACAAWCVMAPGGRRAESLRAPEHRPAGVVRGWWRRRRLSPGEEPDRVRVVVAQVTALLRSGMAPGAAWSRGLGVEVDADGLPDRAALAAAVGGRRGADAVVAGARLAADVGAPLGGVLEAVGGALVAQGEADAEREASLAGPRATARVLLWLPGLGVVLGTALGADPVATATDGGIGTVAVVGGVLALLAGRWWTGRLVAVARGAGEES